MKKETKVYLFTFILWVINVKLFFILSNWNQIWQIWKYSPSIISFFTGILQYFTVFMTTIPTFTLLLTLVFACLLAVFWFYYFKVYFYKLGTVKSGTRSSGFWGVFASILTFLGFGCVACGQTLITSLVLIFVSTSSSYLIHFLGNFSIFLGILFLTYGTYRNYKLYNDKNICKI